MIKAIFGAVLGLCVLSTSAPAFADDATGSQDVLNLLIMSVAVIDYCKLDVDPAVGKKLGAKIAELQAQLKISDDDLRAAGDTATQGIADKKPDCKPDNDYVKAAQTGLDIVKAQ